jgi:hypothetical protein
MLVGVSPHVVSSLSSWASAVVTASSSVLNELSSVVSFVCAFVTEFWDWAIDTALDASVEVRFVWSFVMAV